MNLEVIEVKRRINKAGYVEIKTAEGWKLEHRINVENYIGRKLKSSEIIHHVDEDKTNNNIENLWLFSSQKEHQKWHNKVKQMQYFTHPMIKSYETRWNRYINKEIDKQK